MMMIGNRRVPVPPPETEPEPKPECDTDRYYRERNKRRLRNNQEESAVLAASVGAVILGLGIIHWFLSSIIARGIKAGSKGLGG